MKRSQNWLKSRSMVAGVIFAVGSAACMPALKAGEKLAEKSQSEAPAGRNSGQGVNTVNQPTIARDGQGITVHIDPKTGEFLPKRPDDLVLPPAKGTQVSAPQFFEVPSPTPGGGVMIDLKGQFRTPLVATIDAGGKVRLKHEAVLPVEKATKK